MSTDLVATNGRYTFAEAQNIGEVFAKSGYFKDVTDVAKAITKVLAGQELGIGPMQSMTGVHIVQGKPTLSATLVGALIKRSGRYDFRVRSLSDTECTLVFTENGEPVGDSTFTMGDAQAAGLTSNPTWKKFPRNMLHSRALTNGARWYCPDVFGGAIYTPDELGAVVDGETGEVLSVPETPPPPPSPEPPPIAASSGQVAEILDLEQQLEAAGVFTLQQFSKALNQEYGVAAVSDLDESQAAELRDRLMTKLSSTVEEEESQFQIPAGAR